MNEKIIAGIIGGIAGGTISLISSYILAKVKMKHEIKIWNTDFAVNYSKLLIENPDAAAQLARQFAIGLLIVRDSEGKTASKHFIPYQCKVSVGRKEDNDIVLVDETVSRDHGVFFYRGNKVMFQEFSPLNETTVNGNSIKKLCHLKSGDTLILGKTILEFEELK
ncbi:FHA domain-containing protein [Aquimarina sp. AU474]|uniref:FHA domain-containing protein n=1 Tax=Aquimarina sp. AU474 TaxID=2108529 RepID=UPI000D6875DB|nr:FHA domain-containing protein [Aquimarina sp. AU474]